MYLGFTMDKYLIKLADHLDKKGLYKEANYVDWIIKKKAEENSDELQTHADFIRAINDAFIYKEDEDMLIAIQAKAKSFSDKEFAKEIDNLCNELIGTLMTLEDLRDASIKYI